MKKKTTEEFINEAKKIHGNKYDYTKVVYEGINKKVCIICHEEDEFGREHGEFWQAPYAHLRGQRCPKCTHREKLGKDNFILRSKNIHNNKYDYSNVNYIDSTKKVCIICPIHGEFWQKPSNHLMGNGCPTCARLSIGERKRRVKESKILINEFRKKELQRQRFNNIIDKAKKIHGDKYDYSMVNYKNVSEKVEIICPEHGSFYKRLCDHVYSRCGCPECSSCKKLDTNSFIEKAKLKHGDKYDYSKVDYKHNKDKVCIVCHEKDADGSEHGEFWQRPNDHLTGYGCPKCAISRQPTTEEWIKKAIAIHGNKYDYSKVKYTNAKEKVCIICPVHGEFWQIPNNHLNGANCPECNSDNKSKMEENIHFLLKKEHIKHIRQKTFDWLKHKSHLYLDFYLPEYDAAIEVQGEQHFRPVEKFGGNDNFILQKERDETKSRLCSENGIRLFYITKRNYNINEVLSFIYTKKHEIDENKKKRH